MVDNEITLTPEDRVLLIINDNFIHGSTRFQKYGFLLFKQYQKEFKKLQSNHLDFEFYDDWKPYHYGPYSEQLDKDIKNCIKNKILDVDENSDSRYSKYKLTLKGRDRWRKIFHKSPDELITINDKIRNLQEIKFIELLRQIYNAYPKYAIKNKIRNQSD